MGLARSLYKRFGSATKQKLRWAWKLGWLLQTRAHEKPSKNNL